MVQNKSVGQHIDQKIYVHDNVMCYLKKKGTIKKPKTEIRKSTAFEMKVFNRKTTW